MVSAATSSLVSASQTLKVLEYFQLDEDADAAFYFVSDTVVDEDDEPDFVRSEEFIESESPETDEAPPVKAASKPKKPPTKKPRSNIDTYYSLLSKYPPFKKEEEILVFKKYNALKKKSKKSKLSTDKAVIDLRNHIVERNLKFVVKLSKSFWKDDKPETLESLISAGNVGLIRAIDRFDLNRGVRFLTYAANWIALEIRIELSNNHLIKIPVWWQKTVRKLTLVYNELAKDADHVNVADLAARSEVPSRLITGNPHKKTITKDHLPGFKADVAFCEGLHHDETADVFLDPEREYMQTEIRACVRDSLHKLKPRERIVLEAVFGIHDDDPKNLRQVSNVLGNTGERVRQLREKGLESLKKKILAPRELGGLGITSHKELV